jgi:TolA-binding protein
MYYKFISIAVLLISLIQLTGCASRSEVEGFQSDMLMIKQNLGEISQRQRSTQQLDSLDAALLSFLRERLRDNELILRTMKADQLQSATELRSLIETIAATLDDVGSYNRRLAQKVDELNLILARQGLRQQQDSLLSADPQWLYNQATLDLYRGFPELARAGYREYLYRFPGGEMSDLCSFWIADCWLSEQKPDSALFVLEGFEANYPDSAKLPAATFRRALLLLANNREPEGIELLNKIIQDWPESNEAKLAAERLAE